MQVQLKNNSQRHHSGSILCLDNKNKRAVQRLWLHRGGPLLRGLVMLTVVTVVEAEVFLQDCNCLPEEGAGGHLCLASLPPGVMQSLDGGQLTSTDL